MNIMNIKNYTTISLNNLPAMQAAATEIASEISLAHSSSRTLRYLKSAPSASAGKRHFIAIVKSYYGSLARNWLDGNGIEALPSEFDEWADMGGAAKAHIMALAGIKVALHNGWATTDTWLG